MANSVYRVTLLNCEAAANGMVYFDSKIELRTGTNPNYIWVESQNGHRTLVMEAAEVLAIKNDPLLTTNVLKRQALYALAKEKALAWGIDSADEAFLFTQGLLTFPDAVIIRQ